ncbi:MAG TPA: lytic murein transglycosylase [Kineosporiaceae bacterium]
MSSSPAAAPPAPTAGVFPFHAVTPGGYRPAGGSPHRDGGRVKARPPAADTFPVGVRAAVRFTAFAVAVVLAGVPAAGLPVVAAAATAPSSGAGTGGRTTGPGSGRSPGQVPGLLDDARTARLAAEVDELTERYRRHSAAAAAAAARLAHAYRRVAAADAGVQAAADRLARAREALADRVLDLYALGPAADAGLSLLVAGSTDDALWALSVGGPLADRLLAGATAAQDDAETATAAARYRTDRALQAAAEVNATLTTLREEQDAAAWVRDQATRELARLRAFGRDRKIATLAAARLARARRAAEQARAPGPVAALPIPADYARDYRDAAITCPGLSWTLLAAVGQVESGHGQNVGPSSAGAIGPMQFMPATFAAYAVDGDQDGIADPWTPRDAIFTAARYLCATGVGNGPDGVHAALLAYNHAEWYVDLVLSAESAIASAIGG